MEETLIPPADFVKGFNEGYILKKHEPEIADEISKIDHQSNRMEGLKAGINEYAAEKRKSFYPSWMKRPATPEKDSNEMDKDLDHDTLDK